MQESDIVSLHVPVTHATTDMVNNAFIAKLKPNALLVNTADANLIKENDLAHNLDINKQLFYACD